MTSTISQPGRSDLEGWEQPVFLRLLDIAAFTELSGA